MIDTRSVFSIYPGMGIPRPLPPILKDFSPRGTLIHDLESVWIDVCGIFYGIYIYIYVFFPPWCFGSESLFNLQQHILCLIR